MTGAERAAVVVTHIKAGLKTGWGVPNSWISELLTAYDELKVVADTADTWRRAYNNRVASATGLVDGHDAAYWARNCKYAVDVARANNVGYAALSARHGELSTAYLALRAKYDRLQQVATLCEEELCEIRRINA